MLLRLKYPEVVLEQARKAARDKGVSLAEFIGRAFIEKLSAMIPDPYLEARAKRGDLKKFRAVLAMVPDVPPEDYDRFE